MFTITADELPRFMACQGSRKMFRSVPPSPEGDQTTRDEGTAAHWLANVVAKGEHTLDELIDRKAPNGVYIDATMAEHVGDYLAALGAAPLGGKFEVETSFGNDIYRVNARADYIEFNSYKNTLRIDDFKYGWRIVEPFMHWTLIAHAIGFCIINQAMPTAITFRIHQPRPHHRDGKIREWQISYGELMELQAQLIVALSAPSDQLNTGPQCDTCPALATCPAARAASYNAIDLADTVFNETVPNDELTFHIDQLRRAQSLLEARLKASEELAIHRLRNGQILDNYSVESTLTNRQWKDGIDVAMLQALTGKNCAAKPKAITPAQLEKQGVAKEIVNSLSERIPTGFKLVRVSAAAKAKKIFGDNPTTGAKQL
jgi:hypothetical protein